MALGNTPRRETNIAVEASKSYALGLRFVQRGGGGNGTTGDSDRPEAVDLTGFTIRFVATDPPQRGSTEVLNIEATIEEPKSGFAMFYFQASDLTLEPGAYTYDVTMVPPSGYSTPILKGYIEIGGNTDLDDSNKYTTLNPGSDVTAYLRQNELAPMPDEIVVENLRYDLVYLDFERVDGMLLVVQGLVESFRDEMAEQVARSEANANTAGTYRNEAQAARDEMQAWLDNNGFPFWKGTQAEYNAILQKKPEFLYLITDEAVT